MGWWAGFLFLPTLAQSPDFKGPGVPRGTEESLSASRYPPPASKHGPFQFPSLHCLAWGEPQALGSLPMGIFLPAIHQGMQWGAIWRRGSTAQALPRSTAALMWPCRGIARWGLESHGEVGGKSDSASVGV